MDATEQKLEDVSKRLQEATVQLAQTTTVLRQHVGEQKAMNRRLETMAGNIETRVRKLEQWRERVDTAVPTSLMPGEEIKERFESVERDVDKVSEQVSGINRTLAKWGGIVTAAIVVIEIVVRFI